MVPQGSSLTVRDVVVLSFLAEGPTYGYAIEAELQRREVRDWADISRPQIYKSLEKLQLLHYARRSTPSRPARGPDSATFRISMAGRKALNARLAESDWTSERSRPLFLTWLALCSTLPAHDVRAGMRTRERYLRTQLERESATRQAIVADITIESPFPLAMVDFAIRQFEAELHWLEDVALLLTG